MKHARMLLVVVLLTAAPRLRLADDPAANSAGSAIAAARDEFVRADGPGLTRHGAPFRAIGFNQPDLFSAILLDGDAGRTRTLAAIDDASRSGVRFLRFWASGYWPSEMRLYFTNPAAYWAAMDEVFKAAREKGVMLVPSIFWLHYLWPDLCDEPRSAIADPASKTRSAMWKYATEIVTRYKDDPNVLMWEIGNEYFLSADLDAGMNPKADGAGGKHLGTRPERTAADSLTTDMLRSFYTAITTHVHALDPNHLVTSGDAGPRATSLSLRKNFPKPVWDEDGLRDHLASLLTATPQPLDVMSIHAYGNLDGAFPAGQTPERVGGLSVRGVDFLTVLARTAEAARMPLFVGELGQHDPGFSTDLEAGFARAAIDALEHEGGDLIALWAWHFPQQPESNVTGATHPSLLERVQEFNRRDWRDHVRP